MIVMGVRHQNDVCPVVLLPDLKRVKVKHFRSVNAYTALRIDSNVIGFHAFLTPLHLQISSCFPVYHTGFSMFTQYPEFYSGDYVIRAAAAVSL